MTTIQTLLWAMQEVSSELEKQLAVAQQQHEEQVASKDQQLQQAAALQQRTQQQLAEKATALTALTSATKVHLHRPLSYPSAALLQFAQVGPVQAHPCLGLYLSKHCMQTRSVSHSWSCQALWNSAVS